MRPTVSLARPTKT